MFVNQQPRPYLVTFKLPSGDKVTEAVTAFDLSEAMMQASVRLTARGIAGGALYEIAPNSELIEADRKVGEQNRAIDSITEAVSRGLGASIVKKMIKP